jgi:hypothetical protein
MSLHNWQRYLATLRFGILQLRCALIKLLLGNVTLFMSNKNFKKGSLLLAKTGVAPVPPVGRSGLVAQVRAAAEGLGLGSGKDAEPPFPV